MQLVTRPPAPLPPGPPGAATGLPAVADGVDAPGSEVVVLTRLTVARAALGALHANGVPARVRRRAHARRPEWTVVLDPGAELPQVSSRRPCCQRARTRGAFLATGHVARPDTGPQFEVTSADPDGVEVVRVAFTSLGVPVGLARRRGRPILTVRGADAVGAALSTIGAQLGRLRYEEGRVVREVRSDVNRRLNSETANLRRTVDAGLRQARASLFLRRDPSVWERVPPAVRAAGVLREHHPHDTLGRLAVRAGTSRSAMADRLRRLLRAATVAEQRGQRRPEDPRC